MDRFFRPACRQRKPRDFAHMRFKASRIAALSREPRFLLRTVLWILGCGIVIAFGIGLWRETREAHNLAKDPLDLVRKFLQIEPVTGRHDSWKLLESVRSARQNQKAGADVDGSELIAGSTKYLRSDELALFGIY